MSRPKWSAHVVAVLSRHPRARELSLEDVDRLGELVLEALTGAYEHIEDGLATWPLQDDEGRKLYAEVWHEAARMWGAS